MSSSIRKLLLLVALSIAGVALCHFSNNVQQSVVTGYKTEHNASQHIVSVVYADSKTKLLLNGIRERHRRYDAGLKGFIWLPGSGRKLLDGHPVSTSLVYDFQESLIDRIRLMFPDWMDEYEYFTNSAALHWDAENERLLIVLRIWLNRESYELEEDATWPLNYFHDDYLYTQSFDRFMQPLDSGHIIGIPVHGSGPDVPGDGPIDPRFFVTPDTGDIYLSFNIGTTNAEGKYVDYTLFWNYHQNAIYYPQIKGFSPIVDNPDEELPRDKHWGAFNIPGEMKHVYFVHSVDPLRILRCSIELIDCRLIYVAGSNGDQKFDDLIHHLRGGTPFVLYRQTEAGFYYTSFAHVTLHKIKDGSRYYTTNLIVLKVDAKRVDDFRLVYMSYPIKVAPEILATRIVRHHFYFEEFMFGVGLIFENLDTALLGVHVNDHSALIVRIRGLAPILDEVISADLAASSSLQNYSGPEVGEANRMSRIAASTMFKDELIDESGNVTLGDIDALLFNQTTTPLLSVDETIRVEDELK